MRRKTLRRKAGFTLMEVMVASSITLIVMSGFMAVFIHALKIWQQEEIKNELNINLEEAIEKIRQDLRLSSIGVGLMSFYAPSGGEYTAISLPLAPDENNDGLLDRDDDDRIIWNQTVIYHVRPGTPDQLLRTVFAPRWTNASPSDIYGQLCNVVASTSDAQVAAAVLTGETGTSKIVFENLVELTFRAPNATYDCYTNSVSRADNYNWGSLVLSGGTHYVTFTVTNKNASSTGYKLMIDTIKLSASASSRDGELFTPCNVHPVAPYFSYTNAYPTNVYGSYLGPEWVGQGALIWGTDTSTGGITFLIDNDLWCDNNFNSPSYVFASNCIVDLSTNFSPYDVVVASKKGITWSAVDCGDQASPTALRVSTTVTNYMYGGTNDPLQVMKLNGCWARFFFDRETNSVSYSLLITNARIYTADGTSYSNITFNGGADYVFMYPEDPGTTNSDWVPLWEIDQESRYMVKFETSESVGDLMYDWFAGTAAPSVGCYTNKGTVSSPAWASYGAAYLYCWNAGSCPQPYLADMDGDGDYDMWVGGGSCSYDGSGGAHYFRNTGTSRSPVWTYVGRMGSPCPCSCSNGRLCLGDLNGDGCIDMLFGHGGTGIYFSRNVCSRKYMDSAGSNWSAFATIASLNGGENYPSPELADIDGDGLLELFSGTSRDGDLYYWDNTGTRTAPVFTLVSSSYLGTNAPTAVRSIPRFVDIDGDGILDLFIGCGQGGAAPDGTLFYYHNSGTVLAPVWDAPADLGTAATGWIAPAFANINGSVGAWGNSPAYWINSSGITLSSTNTIVNANVIGLSSVEVGYPKFAKFRSGIFDTTKTAPVYGELNWTEEVNAGCDVRIRARFSNMGDMSDVGESDWIGQGGGTNYFHDNTGNNIPSGTSYRYVQYEAALLCGIDGNTWAHTNNTPPMLRDVTINWPAAAGLVDLRTDLGKGPDCGIVSVSVDGQSLVKGIEGEMRIYKAGRTGTNYATGKIEVKPLNTGK